MEEEKKKTYTHFRARMVDEYNFRLFTIQQNANRFFAEFIVCNITNNNDARVKRTKGKNRLLKKKEEKEWREKKINLVSRTIGIPHKMYVYCIYNDDNKNNNNTDNNVKWCAVDLT